MDEKEYGIELAKIVEALRAGETTREEFRR